MWAIDHFWMWCVIRLFLGICASILFIVSEAWRIRQVPGATVMRVVREKSYLMLPISKREAFILPRRSFENEEYFNEPCWYASKQLSARRL